jgi:hypothetical protein
MSESDVLDVSPSYYQAGGSLPTEQPTYVERPADAELFTELLSGRFCYVLTARQMGKSSLRVRTMERLARANVACSAVDITQIGKDQTSANTWYFTLCSRIASNLGLRAKLREWWEERGLLTPVARFTAFIEEIVLRGTERPIVIMIDEVDSMLGLDRQVFSTDDFFAAIRACYNARAEKPEYARLTFALFGVAAPEDLMTDPARTPFNIGKAIELGFFVDDAFAAPLLAGLRRDDIDAVAVLRRVLHWTGGQPYLTQRVCQELESVKQLTGPVVDQMVRRLFLAGAAASDPHFAAINNRVLSAQTHNARMLEIYEQVLGGARVASDDSEKAQIYLRLCGLVTRDRRGMLVIANRIYEANFSQKWIEQTRLRIARPFASDVERWLANDRSSSALIRGTVLADAVAWSIDRNDLTRTEKEFLEASRLNEQEERVQRGLAAAARRLRILAAGLVVLLIIAVAAILQAKQKATALEVSTRKNDSLSELSERSKQESIASEVARANREGRFQDAAALLQGQLDTANARLLYVRALADSDSKQIVLLQARADSLARDTVRLARQVASSQREAGDAQTRVSGLRDSLVRASSALASANAAVAAAQAQYPMLFRRIGRDFLASRGLLPRLYDTTMTRENRILTLNLIDAFGDGYLYGFSPGAASAFSNMERSIADSDERVRNAAIRALSTIRLSVSSYDRNRELPAARRWAETLMNLLTDRRQALWIRSYAAIGLSRSSDELKDVVIKGIDVGLLAPNYERTEQARTYRQALSNRMIASGDRAIAAAFLAAYPPLYNDSASFRLARQLEPELIELLTEEHDYNEIAEREFQYQLSSIATLYLTKIGTAETARNIEQALSRVESPILRDRLSKLAQSIRAKPASN